MRSEVGLGAKYTGTCVFKGSGRHEYRFSARVDLSAH